MQVLSRPWGAMHYADQGTGPAVMFANSLGTDLRLWDAVLPMIPGRHIRFDKRGHGLSDLGGDVGIDDYADDAIALIEHLDLGPVVFVGLSIGGMIAQSIAARRPDLLRGIVLSNTAAKMGTAEAWTARMATVRDQGIEPIADAIMERWFAPAFRATPQLAPWRNMLTRTTPEGYAAACAAIADADLSALKIALPTLVIAGDADGASPPEVVKATADLIPNARFHVIEGAGHIPCVETPEAHATLITAFLKEVGHV